MTTHHSAAIVAAVAAVSALVTAALGSCWLYRSPQSTFGYGALGTVPESSGAAEKPPMGPRAQKIVSWTLGVLLGLAVLSLAYLVFVFRAEKTRIEHATSDYLTLTEMYDNEMEVQAVLRRLQKRELPKCTQRLIVSLGKYDSRYKNIYLLFIYVVEKKLGRMPMPVDTPVVPYVIKVLKDIPSPELKQALQQLYCRTSLYRELQPYLE